jgi:hypothetical protein
MSSTITALTSGGGLAMAGDTSGQLELKTNNGTTAVTLATDQTATFAGNAVFANNNYTGFKNTSGSATCSIFQDTSNDFWMYNGGATNTRFYTNGTERMRITSGGQVLIGKSVSTVTVAGTALNGNGNNQYNCNGDWNAELYGTGGYRIRIASSDNTVTQVGSITCTASATTYATSSDYRLKQNVTPMTGALSKLSQLKPVTYKWKYDNSDGQGFIAHELQEIFPDAVHGEKDAVETYIDEDGNEQTRIKPQGIDTSFLVATLTAAIQELNAKVDAQALQIQALKGVA